MNANTLLARGARLARGSHQPPCIFTMVSMFARAAGIRHAPVVVARRGQPIESTQYSKCQIGRARIASGSLLARGAQLAH